MGDVWRLGRLDLRNKQLEKEGRRSASKLLAAHAQARSVRHGVDSAEHGALARVDHDHPAWTFCKSFGLAGSARSNTSSLSVSCAVATSVCPSGDTASCTIT